MPRYAETLGMRRTSQSNDRQVLPTPMMAHIKANASATVAGDRCVRRCAWPHEYFDPTACEKAHYRAVTRIVSRSVELFKHASHNISIDV